LKNGGILEKAAAMANHASMRTLGSVIYTRARSPLDEVKRIMV
jgi:hypothetical protein